MFHRLFPFTIPSAWKLRPIIKTYHQWGKIIAVLTKVVGFTKWPTCRLFSSAMTMRSSCRHLEPNIVSVFGTWWSIMYSYIYEEYLNSSGLYLVDTCQISRIFWESSGNRATKEASLCFRSIPGRFRCFPGRLGGIAGGEVEFSRVKGWQVWFSSTLLYSKGLHYVTISPSDNLGVLCGWGGLLSIRVTL